MNPLQWNIFTLALLGRIFLHEVMRNMRFKDATVQFGEMGQGIQPNYQVCFTNGIVNTYRGANHKPFMPLDAFNKEHISRPFSWVEIQHAIDAAGAAR